MKKLLLSALCAVTTLVAGADTATWDFKIAGNTTPFSSGMTLKTTTTSSAGSWTFTYTGTGTTLYTEDNATDGPKFGSGSSYLNANSTLSLSSTNAIPTGATISKVVFTVKGGSKGAQSKWDLKINGSQVGTTQTTTSGNGVSNLTWENLSVVGNQITFELAENATKGLNLQGVEVTYTKANEGGETEELGEIIATYNETAIASEDEITIEQGETIEINVANAKSISAQLGAFPATDVDGATLAWKPETVVSEEVATITATAQDGSTKTLEFFLTVTEKTAVDVNDTEWVRITKQDEIKDGLVFAFVGIGDYKKSRQTIDYSASVGEYNSLSKIFSLENVIADTKTNNIATLPAKATIFTLEATDTEGQFYIKSGDNYLSNSTKNTVNFGSDSKDPFTLTYDSNTQFVAVVDQSTEATSKYWAINASSNRFAIYNSVPVETSSAAEPVYMYYQPKSDSTSISEVVVDGKQSGAMFDLQGRRVLTPRKGMIYIQSGKKIRF